MQDGPAWVVLPTYNEAANIEEMVEAVLAKLPESGRVLVVDDNSPDGTGAIAERLAEGDDRVEVLHRPRKDGLGPAYSQASGARCRPVPAWCSRWTLTSPTIPPTSRDCWRRPSVPTW